jgi:diketogulonate reductase-like aldo/keto reductase
MSAPRDAKHLVTFPGGDSVPALGMGTWNMGDEPEARAEEIATLRLGLDLGARLIDTAEMYGDGRAEELVGEAIAGRRSEVVLVSKVLPSNASLRGTQRSCDASLRRLRTDHLDLYLLHWPGNVPLAETLDGFARLHQAGKIRYFGVSNLDVGQMRELWSLAGGRQVQTDQVLYNLTRRGIEWDLLPWLRQYDIPVMAYSPIEQGRILAEPKLTAFARRNGLTPAQVALGWLLARKDVIAIPKTSRGERLKENFAALHHCWAPDQLAELERLFPPPSGPAPLEML